MGHRPVSLVLMLSACLLGACGLFGSEGPEEAELKLSGVAGKQVRLIVSNNFLSSREPVIDEDTGFVLRDTVIVELLTAETTMVALPFERVYDIRDNQQFYALIKRQEPGGDGLVAVLRVDGKIRSDQRPSASDSLVTIIYNFGNRFPEQTDVTV